MKYKSIKPFLVIQDDNEGFKVLVSKDDVNKIIFDDKNNSLRKSMSRVSSILNISDLLSFIEYGDEYFQDFIIDTEHTDGLQLQSIIDQLEKVLPSLIKGIDDQDYSDDIALEMKGNMISDLAASTFDALVAQLLVFVLNSAREINIEEIQFDTDLMEIPRFKKLVTEELNIYGFTLIK